MTWAVFLALLGVAVVVAAAWLLGRPKSAERFAGMGEYGGLGEPEDAAAPAEPDRHLGAPGFGAQVRGYRMDQVDAVLDRLGREVSAREQELTILRERLGEPEPSTEMGEEAHDRG